MKTLPQIAGIRENAEHAKSLAGKLALPKEFNRVKYAAKWSEKGFGVEQEMQEQHISPTIIADGWTVWKHNGRICQRVLSGKVYVLMVRPKALQQNINAICGNLSREKIVKEHSGETSGGKNLEDHGMLTANDLNMVERDTESSEPLSRTLAFNKVKPLDTASASQATSKPKLRK